MRREQAAALSWGVGLVLAAILGVILAAATVASLAYCAGMVLA